MSDDAVMVQSEAGLPFAGSEPGNSVSDREGIEQLRQHLLEVEGRARADQETVPAIAHDLRNLLTVISAHAQLAMDQPDVKGELRNDLEGIVRGIQQADALVSSLLQGPVSKLPSAAPMVLDASIVPVCELLKALLGSQHSLQVALRATVPIRVDPIEFERILINLILNAREAMPNGGVITLETEDAVSAPPSANQRRPSPPGKHAVLRVRDVGLGMTSETRARLFTPFFSTKGQGKGRGLGLATVAALVAKYRGAIDVQSTLGAGTTFEVYFRAEPAEADGRWASEQPAISGDDSVGSVPTGTRTLPCLEIVRGEAGHVALGWVGAGVLFASFHGHLSCALSDAYVVRLEGLLLGQSEARYFVDSSDLASFELAARTNTIRSLSSFAASIQSVLVLKWSGGESSTGRVMLKELAGFLATTDSRSEFDAALQRALTAVIEPRKS